jgi:putative flippase GtrA
VSVPLNQIRQADEPRRDDQPSGAQGPSPARGSAVALRLPLIVQFLKFGIVGVSNTLLAFGIYTVLVKVFGVWYVAASGIGFSVGAVNGFLLNRKWTFKEHTGDALTPVRWAIVQSCGLGCNLGLVYLFVSGAGLDELVGQAFATGIVTVLTFAANRSWTFRVRPQAALAAPDARSSETG